MAASYSRERLPAEDPDYLLGDAGIKQLNRLAIHSVVKRTFDA